MVLGSNGNALLTCTGIGSGLSIYSYPNDLIYAGTSKTGSFPGLMQMHFIYGVYLRICQLMYYNMKNLPKISILTSY